MGSQSDFDQGGTFRQFQSVYMGPSVGWVSVPDESIVPVITAGTTNIPLGATLVYVNVNGAVTLQLPSAKDGPVPAISVTGPYAKVPITILDIGGFAQAHPITILPFGAENIMGLTQIQITSNYGGFTLVPSNSQQGWGQQPLAYGFGGSLTSSGSGISVTTFGAVGDGVTDDTAAIQAALNTGRAVYFPNPPGGFYKISAPLDIRNNIGQHLTGENSRKTKINQVTPNTQVLRVGGSTLAGGAGQVIQGLWLQTNSEQPSTNTNAIGLELNQAFGSIFQDLVIYRTVTSVGINQAVNPNYAFSNTFDELWINNFSLRALDFRSVVAGSTGNVFLNIYCNNLKDDGVTRGSCTRAIEFAIHASTFLSVINVEDCTPSSDCVMFQQVRGGEVVALHFERVNMDQSSTAFCNIVDDQTNLVINGLDVHFCEIGQGNLGQIGIIGYFGNPRAHLTGVNTVSNTNNGTQFYFISSIFGTTGAIEITESNVSGTNGEQLVVAANPPVVKRINLDWRHRTEGGNNILWGTAAPVTGTWSVGDRVYQTAPTSGGFIGFVCTTGGTPGTWKTFGAIS